MSTVPKGQDLFIISGDGDFCSPLEECALTPYLKDEWKRNKESNCALFCSLATFLKQYFPQISLADEVGRTLAIDRFVHSPNFATTHRAIRELEQVDDFSRDELLQLINAFGSNEQIRWILGDDDVKNFGWKIIALAHGNGIKEEAEPLMQSLTELDAASPPS